MASFMKQIEPLKIKIEVIKSATNGFGESNCIGRGGFGKVYKGEIGHTMVAIKRLNREFGQGDPEFWKEIMMLSNYKHENIVSLIGYCDDCNEKILVYEYAQRRSLDLYLDSVELTWVQRLNICIGAARGLAYLHSPTDNQLRVLHRDIKSSNILLDENWNAKISDFGLSKLGPANRQFTFLVTNAVGTLGYCDPLYVETTILTKESDVYSFGVVLFEVLCGRLCIDKKQLPLTGLVRQCYEGNRLNEIIHGSIKVEIEPQSLQMFTKIAYRCLRMDREGRPLMMEIVEALMTALNHQVNVNIQAETSTKSGKPEIKGVSMTELFTPEQVREHIAGLRQWVGQSKAKAENYQAMENSMNENSCQLCAVEKLTFEPPHIYCTSCGARIKRNAMFYAIGTGDTRPYFCIPCYNETHGDTINVNGINILKVRLQKKKNDEETEEWWVQCDKCEAWQHQICALFNGRRNDGGPAEYTCPNCYIEEVERGERKPLPQSAVLGAKDLPRTILSDHIEDRLFRRLKQERMERARFHGKSYNEVPGAEALVVRVVSSVDKKLEVKQRFLEIFQEENYPKEFGYKSKVVLLFQKIEGVEVCLFGMYVHEFGAECEQPNHRRVYLSCLDSVKYFRPEIRTVTGETLCTFVYQEILSGYLEYCKLRGFTSCYIWACPPLNGEDYIFYCHPEIQKTPKFDKLREWYLTMLRKASKENIVVELTNLYDHFFMSSGECKAKVTAARLPYFDGDYWPGAAEDIIFQLLQEEEGRKQNKKARKMITRRALKASGQTDLTGNASKDLLLMHRLGETISPMKEDFIMVHLQPSCTHCRLLMVSGKCWVCKLCTNFRLCDRCHEIEQKLEERERHPINHREKHPLSPIKMNDVPTDTKDKDEILESEFFDMRQAFLSLCQGNHYQHDTLRRAKHSSMMVLYHLHNPTTPVFVTTCNRCHLDIETRQGWCCEVCPDYDVCNSCYYNDGGVDHPHKFTNHSSIPERDAQNKEARLQRVLQLREMLSLLVHSSQCRPLHCQYPNCCKVKGLFRHGINCKVRASGDCVLCKKMWYLLQLHARACKESQCHVPRCRDLKEHLTMLQQQSDSRRRAAVMEMMRQRSAELAGMYIWQT